MSLSNVSQFNTAINTGMGSTVIPFNGAGVSPSYIYGSAVEQGVELSVNNYGTVEAFRVVDGGLGADGVSATATEMLSTEAVVNGEGVVTGTNVVKFPATNTGAGTVKSGALAASVPIGYVAGGIAIGAGIGLKEAATHTRFWNDLVSIGDGINSPTDTVRVIWRALQDGGIQSYCDKRTVDKLIKRMYDLNVLNSGRVEPIIDHTGLQDVTFGNIDIQVVSSAVAASTSTPSVAAVNAAYQAAINAAGVQPFNAISANASSGSVSVSLYNMPEQLYIISDANGNFRVNTPVPGKVTCGHCFYNPDTGEIIGVNIETASDFVYIGATNTVPGFSGYGFASNVGTRVIPVHPDIIKNFDDLEAPYNYEDFWNTFSEWLDNSFEQPGYNPWNNTITPTTWIPFTFPINTNWQVQPATGVQPTIWDGQYELPDPYPEPQPEPQPDPLPIPEPWIWPSFDKIKTPEPDPHPPEPTPWDDTPEPPPKPPVGDTPVSIVDPTSIVSSSDALFTVYNPTQSQVNALGAYLWTNSIIDLISQFFQNPLDAIISLHVVYCVPDTSGTKNIKLGYLDSGVAAAKVTSQYKTIDCGDITIPEVYHNALDYSAVKLNLFLPFIGFRELSVKECMAARLNVQYKIDIYTGTCLALIYVIRPNVRQLLYTFEGNCSVQIPLTGADRSRLVAGLVTAGVSAFTGNPAGVIGGIGSIGVNIERSGGFSGNAGAMGVKKPYLVINRAINAQADGYNTKYGFPLNKMTKLIELKGYTRVQSVHVDIPYATREECEEIHAMLTRGIII